MFKHYFNFVGLPEIGRIQIAEPIGFDAESHKVKQDEGRFGRDVVLGNEENELTIYREHFELMDNFQTLPDGTRFNYASQGFDYVASEITQKGWECKIEYIIQKDGVDFITGIIDGYTATVKQDEIKFQIIQNTKREEIKRREDIYIDAFSDKDLDGNTIPPCTTTNILLKAKPIFQVSEWGDDLAKFFATPIPVSMSPFQIVKQYGIENTLSFLGGTTTTVGDLALVMAVNELSSIHIVVDMTYQTNGMFFLEFDILQLDGDRNPVRLLYNEILGHDDGTNYNYNLDIVLSDNIPKGHFICPRFRIDSGNILITHTNLLMEVVSTGIDSVFKGVRLIDLMKHNVKSVGNVPLHSSIYDFGGEHYDNFAFNGYLLGGITDKPFNNRFKDIIDIPQEICADYQINPDNVEIMPFNNYYTNNEIGAFLEIPDEENTTTFNKRFFLKEYWLGYNKSSSERQTNNQNTIDDVHTDSQWLFPSKKTDGVLKLNINHSRSAYLIEEARKRSTKIEEKTSSLQYDESLFLLDCVVLPPGTRRVLQAVLSFQVNGDGRLQILSDGSFNWTLLGFNVGNTVIVTESSGTNNYLVYAYESSVITLEGIGFTPSGSGQELFKIDYPITNVQYTNRTNEGFTLIQGVLLPEKYSNLNYSIKRNIQRWFSYLATASKFLPGKNIKNTLFRVNGDLVTKKIGETSNVVDKGDIVIDYIADLKILTPNLHKVTVFCDFDTATQLFEDVRDLKGFVRVQLNTNDVIKGYPKELDYEWSTNKLTFLLEEKFVTDYDEITNVGSDIFINGVIYNLDSFSINNNFVSLYDTADILITKIKHFTAIKINGTAYTDVDLFAEDLEALLTL